MSLPEKINDIRDEYYTGTFIFKCLFLILYIKSVFFDDIIKNVSFTIYTFTSFLLTFIAKYLHNVGQCIINLSNTLVKKVYMKVPWPLYWVLCGEVGTKWECWWCVQSSTPLEYRELVLSHWKEIISQKYIGKHSQLDM